jgi:hypothetical protein
MGTASISEPSVTSRTSQDPKPTTSVVPIQDQGRTAPDRAVPIDIWLGTAMLVLFAFLFRQIWRVLTRI